LHRNTLWGKIVVLLLTAAAPQLLHPRKKDLNSMKKRQIQAVPAAVFLMTTCFHLFSPERAAADTGLRKRLTIFYTTNNYGYIEPCG
jgi:hypothetical protein